MAKKIEESEADKKAAEELAKEEAALKTAPEWIRCKVGIPNSHVGEIECRIPGNTPAAERFAAACKAAAEVRGIALNAVGVPQFASAPNVEFLES